MLDTVCALGEERERYLLEQGVGVGVGQEESKQILKTVSVLLSDENTGR